ncbi:MAG: hypothetical protein Q4B70_11140 [Lachnospiraceae bacterium]|nr:hypothetical protein [Lachnospiraceae bacterium]
MIEDDGVGFDMEEIYLGKLPSDTEGTGSFHQNGKQTPKAHIGISNVKQRLEIMCDGDLTVVSKKGMGTVSIIRIPPHTSGMIGIL